MIRKSRISPPGKGSRTENSMTRNPGTNVVKLSIGNWLTLCGILVPIAATIIFTTVNRQRDLGVKLNTVIVQQDVIDNRISRVENTLDSLLLHDTGFSR